MWKKSIAAALCCSLFACAAEEDFALGEDESLAGLELAATEIEAELSADFLEAVVEEVANDKIIKGDLKWAKGVKERVDVTRVDKDTVNVDLDLRADKFIDISIDVDFKLSFTCDWKRPAIRLHIDSWSTNANLPAWLKASPFISSILDNKADNTVRNKVEEKIKTDMLDAIHVDVGQYCPDIQVTSAGDVRFLVGRGDECNNGAKKKKTCTSPEYGSGFHYLCVNGYWELNTDDCGICDNGDLRTRSCPVGYEGKVNEKCIGRAWRFQSDTCRWDSTPSGPIGGGGGGGGRVEP